MKVKITSLDGERLDLVNQKKEGEGRTMVRAVWGDTALAKPREGTSKITRLNVPPEKIRQLLEYWLDYASYGTLSLHLDGIQIDINLID